MEQKKNGRIKHLGFSAHGSVEVIKRFLAACGEHIMSDTIPLTLDLALLPTTDDTAVGNAVETICMAAVQELKAQGLTTLEHDFLDCHTAEVMGHIQNPVIRNLHVMQG